MKCPVCKSELESIVKKCSNCGFDELQREFINAEDAVSWFENVIVPYRVKWEQNKNQPVFLSADELYAQLTAKQRQNIANHINETINEFETIPYGDGLEITCYNGTSATVVIPNQINGKTVLKLGDSLFENCKWITDVTLPNELTTIGSKVFRNTSLAHIAFPNSIKEIGEEAFAWSAITEIIFPPSVEIIPDGICEYCKKLATVIIMGAIEIGKRAFCVCETMTRLGLPETLVTISDNAFSCCFALDNIILPASLQSIYGDFHGSARGSVVILNDNLIWSPKRRDSLTRGITIFCNPGSTSQQHARDWGIKMKLLSEYQR